MLFDFLNTEVSKLKFNLKRTGFLIAISIIGLILAAISLLFICLGLYYFLLSSGYEPWVSALVSSGVPAAILLFLIAIYWVGKNLGPDSYHLEATETNNHSWLGEVAQFATHPGHSSHHPDHSPDNHPFQEEVHNLIESVKLKPLDVGVSALVLGLVIGASPAVRRKLFGLLK